MGILHGTKFLGISLQSTVDLTERLRGKSAAFEAYGFLHEIVAHHYQTATERALTLSAHLWNGDTMALSDIAFAVENFTKEMMWLNIFFENKFVVVFEGPSYEAKAAVTQARRSTLLQAYNDHEYRKSLTIPDCLVRMAIASLQKSGVKTLVPPCEADSQLAFMQVRGVHAESDEMGAASYVFLIQFRSAEQSILLSFHRTILTCALIHKLPTSSTSLEEMRHEYGEC